MSSGPTLQQPPVRESREGGGREWEEGGREGEGVGGR